MRSVFLVKGISEISFCNFLRNFFPQVMCNFFFQENLVPVSGALLYAFRFSCQGHFGNLFLQFPAKFLSASDVQFFLSREPCSRERSVIICVPFFLSRAFRKSLFAISCEISFRK